MQLLKYLLEEDANLQTWKNIFSAKNNGEDLRNITPEMISKLTPAKSFLSKPTELHVSQEETWNIAKALKEDLILFSEPERVLIKRDVEKLETNRKINRIKSSKKKFQKAQNSLRKQDSLPSRKNSFSSPTSKSPRRDQLPRQPSLHRAPSKSKWEQIRQNKRKQELREKKDLYFSNKKISQLKRPFDLPKSAVFLRTEEVNPSAFEYTKSFADDLLIWDDELEERMENFKKSFSEQLGLKTFAFRTFHNVSTDETEISVQPEPENALCLEPLILNKLGVSSFTLKKEIYPEEMADTISSLRPTLLPPSLYVKEPGSDSNTLICDMKDFAALVCTEFSILSFGLRIEGGPEPGVRKLAPLSKIQTLEPICENDALGLPNASVDISEIEKYDIFDPEYIDGLENKIIFSAALQFTELTVCKKDYIKSSSNGEGVQDGIEVVTLSKNSSRIALQCSEVFRNPRGRRGTLVTFMESKANSYDVIEKNMGASLMIGEIEANKGKFASALVEACLRNLDYVLIVFIRRKNHKSPESHEVLLEIDMKRAEIESWIRKLRIRERISKGVEILHELIGELKNYDLILSKEPNSNNLDIYKIE